MSYHLSASATAAAGAQQKGLGGAAIVDPSTRIVTLRKISTAAGRNPDAAPSPPAMKPLPRFEYKSAAQRVARRSNVIGFGMRRPIFGRRMGRYSALTPRVAGPQFGRPVNRARLSLQKLLQPAVQPMPGKTEPLQTVSLGMNELPYQPPSPMQRAGGTARRAARLTLG